MNCTVQATIQWGEQVNREFVQSEITKCAAESLFKYNLH